MKFYSIFTAVFLVQLGVFAKLPDKKTVCSATINSSEEINTFKKNFNPQLWNFVELAANSGAKAGEDWFHNACRQKVQCDVLILSGHFGGSFWGDKSKQTLSLDTMENSSCEQDCSGILKRPAEVFLFGCNTLAGKEKDSRTPEEYEQALIDHSGMSRAQAQQVVAYRYSLYGNTFSDRMTHVFSKTKRIYGFSSISPTGRTIQPFLNNYLVQTKSQYENFNIMNVKLNTQLNVPLMSSLKNFPIAQIAGADVNNASPPMKPYCYLGSGEISRLDKIKYIKTTLESGKALTIIPYITNFISRMKFQGVSFTQEEENVLNSLQSNHKLKSEFKTFLTLEGDVYLKLKYDILSLMRDLNIIVGEEFEREIKNVLKISFKAGFDWTKKDVLCSINQKVELDSSDVPSNLWESSEFIIALGCLKPSDDAIQSKLLEIYIDGEKRMSDIALDSLKKMGALSPATHKKLIDFILSNKAPSKLREALMLATASIEKNPYKNDQMLKLVFEVILKQQDTKFRNLGIILLACLKPTDTDSLNKMKAFAEVEKEYELKMRMMSILNRY